MSRLDDGQVGGDHYKKMAITPWDFLKSCLTPEELRGYFKGEAIVYIAREREKGGDTDIAKARHVLQRLEVEFDFPANTGLTIEAASVAMQRLTLAGYSAEQFIAFAQRVLKTPGAADIAAALQHVAAVLQSTSGPQGPRSSASQG